MPTFTDQLSLSLLDDAFVSGLLTDDLDLEAAVDRTYRIEQGQVHAVSFNRVLRRSFQVPVHQTVRGRRTDNHHGAASHQVQSTWDEPRRGLLSWIDALLEVEVTAVVEDRATPVKEVRAVDLLTDLGDPSTPAELETALTNRYGADVAAAILDRLRLHHPDELRERGPALRLEIEAEAVPAFNPDDPENQRPLPLRLCVIASGALEPNEALRRARLCRSLLEAESSREERYQDLELLRPYIFLVLFPASVAGNNAISGMNAATLRARIRDLFAAEGMFALFLSGF